MDAKDSLMIKVVNKDTYTFFNSDSEKLSEFTLGTRSPNVKVKGREGIAGLHLRFSFSKYWYVQDISGRNNVYLNKKSLGEKPARIKAEDVITIMPSIHDKKTEPVCKVEVIKKINNKARGNKTTFSLTRKNEYYLGSDPDCDIVIQGDAEPKHCKIVYDGSDFYIEDLHSLDGIFLNNRRVKRAKLENYDRLSFGGAAYIFYDKSLLYSKGENGIEIEAVGVEKIVYDRKARKKIKLVDNISLNIPTGSFVAIIGGSGAGKSTFADCLNGTRPCTSGKVMYDGNDYYENINSYRAVVGIVPQRDIMYDDLTVEKSLFYTAKLRMRRNLTKEEIDERVKKAINDVQLQGKEHLKISSLSGGQKKRVSIAMELLAEPKVIFLDEPTSGLSPDLDLEMMELLKFLASKGRTIIVITHAMENVHLCDRIIILGKGGRLCYYGSPAHMFKYFKTSDFSKIFAYISDENKAIKYQEYYEKTKGGNSYV